MWQLLQERCSVCELQRWQLAVFWFNADPGLAKLTARTPCSRDMSCMNCMSGDRGCRVHRCVGQVLRSDVLPPAAPRVTMAPFA